MTLGDHPHNGELSRRGRGGDAGGIGSLFSGIGLLEKGLEDAGLGHVAWQAEIDPYCRAVLRRHWPQARQYSDVREVDGAADRVRVLCGGFPCQPFSAAGERRGLDDERWLWPEYARIIETLQPAIIVGENVPGLRKAGLPAMLADLARLGFDAEWTHFRASHLGAPHERNRIWIVATHPDRATVRDEPGWLSRASWEAASLVADHGEAWPLADAHTLGRDEGANALRARQPMPSDGAGGKNAVRAEAPSDPNGEGELQAQGRFGELRGWAGDSGWRHAPPAVRGVDDGSPPRLDLRCGAESGCRGEACDHEQAPDAWRVAGLGNAVVYLCGLLVGRAIVNVTSEARSEAA